MSTKTVIIAIAVWMLILIGGYLLFAGGDESTRPPATTAEQAPGEQTPTGEETTTAVPETPAGETPAGETPAGETPAGETPAGETPAGETPAGETPATDPNADPNAAPTPDPEIVGIPLTPEEAISTDPEDNNPKLKARTQKAAKEQALLQELPYENAGYTVENTDVNAENEIIVTVTYPGSKADAVSLYKRLLREANDDGGAYKVVYRKAS